MDIDMACHGHRVLLGMAWAWYMRGERMGIGKA